MRLVPNLTNAHHSWFERFNQLKQAQQLPQAILLIGPQHAGLNDLSRNLATVALCTNPEGPCNSSQVCRSCQLINEADHPDLFFLEPLEKSNVIKIDQIRALQEIVFISPQISNKRVIVIHPAENINPAAANALLKLLEEPPEGLLFLLVVEQISTVPSTIISRCQRWYFPYAEILESEYLEIGEKYNEDSPRKKLFDELLTIIQNLDQLLSKQISVVELASKWANHELNELMWFLYLIHSQLIYYHFIKPNFQKTWAFSLNELSQRLPAPLLFRQMDTICSIKKVLNQNISMNSQLLLENLLLGYFQ